MSDRSLPAELPDDLATLWFLVRRVAAIMDREADALCRRELGVSFAHFLVLSVVDAYPGHLSQQAIADRLGLTKGTVSRQIEAAAASGLMVVTVAPHTRRENSVSLTAAGTALVQRGDRITQQAQSDWSSAVSPSQLRSTITALQVLLRSLSEAPAGTAKNQPMAARAAAKRAIGTRYGEQDT